MFVDSPSVATSVGLKRAASLCFGLPLAVLVAFACVAHYWAPAQAWLAIAGFVAVSGALAIAGPRLNAWLARYV